MKSLRMPYPLRKILLVGEEQRERAIAALRNAPIDPARALEFVLREEVKERKLDQNALMWVGPLKDIAEQGYVDGKTYSAKVWHEHFKEQYLPEDYDPALCKEGYRKWDYKPNGERVMVGSSTDLTVSGFALYLTKVQAYAASELGVVFHVKSRLAA